MDKKYSLNIDTAINVLTSMCENAKTLIEIEALTMAIDVMQNINTKDVIADGLSIERFNEQLKNGKVEVVQVSYDYYKGFYDGVNSVLRGDKNA